MTKGSLVGIVTMCTVKTLWTPISSLVTRVIMAPNSEVTYGVVVSCGSSGPGVVVECGGGVVDSKLLDLVLDTRQLQQIVLCKKGRLRPRLARL